MLILSQFDPFPNWGLYFWKCLYAQDKFGNMPLGQLMNLWLRYLLQSIQNFRKMYILAQFDPLLGPTDPPHWGLYFRKCLYAQNKVNDMPLGHLISLWIRLCTPKYPKFEKNAHSGSIWPPFGAHRLLALRSVFLKMFICSRQS